jgi:hypothetical protein
MTDSKTTEEPDPLPDDLAELCLIARINWPILQGFGRNQTTPRDAAYACRAGAQLIKALEAGLRKTMMERQER